MTADADGDAVRVTTNDGCVRTVDHVLDGTGYAVDTRRYSFLSRGPRLPHRLRERLSGARAGPGELSHGAALRRCPRGMELRPAHEVRVGHVVRLPPDRRPDRNRAQTMSLAPRTTAPSTIRIPPRRRPGARRAAARPWRGHHRRRRRRRPRHRPEARPAGRPGRPSSTTSGRSRASRGTPAMPSRSRICATTRRRATRCWPRASAWVSTAGSCTRRVMRSWRPSPSTAMHSAPPIASPSRSGGPSAGRRTSGIRDEPAPEGVPAPRTWYPRSTADLADIDGEPPFAVKPAIKVHSHLRDPGAKAWRADTREELERLFVRACEVTGGDDEVMVQELIPGGGDHQFAFCAFFPRRRLGGDTVARRIRQHPAEFGRATTFAETVEHPDAAGAV